MAGHAYAPPDFIAIAVVLMKRQWVLTKGLPLLSKLPDYV